MLFLTIDPSNDHYWKVHPTYSKASKNGDVGLDIPMQQSVIVPAHARSFKINLDFKANPTHGYMLVPRSSISKTTVRLANSIGLIDGGYRGELVGMVDNIYDKDFHIKRGERYFQLVAVDSSPIDFELVEELSESSRGEGGFGSTGR